MTSLKSSSRSNSRLVNLKAAVFAAFLTSSICFGAPAATSAVQPAGKPVVPKATPPSKSGFENHQDLILKAQNLTLQRDRLQTSQILIRGIQRETRGSPAYKDLTKALSDLTTVFYTEKAQSVFSVGEANVESKPKDAVESFQEALRIEDGNVTILKALARVQLSLGDCEKADATLRSAEALDPYSAEVKLLNLQSLACAKSFDALLLKVEAPDIDFENAEVFVKNLRTGLQVQSLLNLPKPKQDLKKVKTVLTTLETQMPDTPKCISGNGNYRRLRQRPIEPQR